MTALRRLALVSLLLALGLAPAAPAAAQNYRFSVPEAKVTVEVEKSGAALIHYSFTFQCAPGAHPIDIVDVGMPGKKHEALSAAANSVPLPAGSIRPSTYVPNGYEIHLGNQAIGPGGRGTVEFIARERDMVWQDTTDPEQASFRFTPTWFGAQYVSGPTKLILRYKLPIPASEYPAAKEKILWQKKGEDFSAKGVFEDEDAASVAWVRDVRLTGPNLFGVSFPKRYMEKVMDKTIWDLFHDWWAGTPGVRPMSALLLLAAFGLLFFYVTRGTGCSLFVPLVIVLGLFFVLLPDSMLLAWPAVIVLGILARRWRRRSKASYFPAEVCREGGGIKRGLTAVEAAVLLEVPLPKVLTMIVFALARKGVVRIRRREPLSLEVVGSEKAAGVWAVPDGKPVKLWPYEPAFIRAFREGGGKPVEEMNLEKSFLELVTLVSGHMKGFDLKATQEYYRYVVARAWKQVKAEADYEARFVRADRELDWLMLDDDWGHRLGDAGDGRYVYWPWWWHGSGGRIFSAPLGGGGALPGPAGTGPTGSVPSFGDVAGSLVGRMENASAGLVGKLDGLKPGGSLDLSTVDRFTGDFLSDLAKSGGGSGGGGGFGGGGGGGCACACAGCACACACAGGGR
jgi:hypothetical protein